DHPGRHGWQVRRHPRGGPAHGAALARVRGPGHVDEHARTHGIDRAQHRPRSSSHFADPVRHDGVDGSGYNYGHHADLTPVGLRGKPTTGYGGWNKLAGNEIRKPQSEIRNKSKYHRRKT